MRGACTTSSHGECCPCRTLLVTDVAPCAVLDGRNSWRTWLKSMKCMSILWALVLMPRRSVPLLTLMVRFSAVGCSVETRVEVSSIAPSPAQLYSRRSSRGLTQKSLQRLFPCDQSMVVIIDDRADVWEWSPNLVKVIPCKLHFSKVSLEGSYMHFSRVLRRYWRHQLCIPPEADTTHPATSSRNHSRPSSHSSRSSSIRYVGHPNAK